MRKCFNTSHVVIYHDIKLQADCSGEFQYISCCYLSNIHGRLITLIISFNTSHVVIYPGR